MIESVNMLKGCRFVVMKLRENYVRCVRYIIGGAQTLIKTWSTRHSWNARALFSLGDFFTRLRFGEKADHEILGNWDAFLAKDYWLQARPRETTHPKTEEKGSGQIAEILCCNRRAVRMSSAQVWRGKRRVPNSTNSFAAQNLCIGRLFRFPIVSNNVDLRRTDGIWIRIFLLETCVSISVRLFCFWSV